MLTRQADIHQFTFHIWERLHIQAGEEGRKGTYVCRIEDIAEDHLVISRPQFESGYSLLADNRRVVVHCARADAAYSFTARIKEMQPKSPTSMYLLDIGRISRLQRRRFVRLDIAVRLQYRIIARPIRRPVILTTHNLLDSISMNLSAGGFLIAAPKPIKPDDLLMLLIAPCKFGNLPRWMLAACRHVQTLEGGQRAAGAEFILKEDLPRHLNSSEMGRVPESLTLFDDKMQNHLVAELFAEQLLMRQKGIL